MFAGGGRYRFVALAVLVAGLAAPTAVQAADSPGVGISPSGQARFVWRQALGANNLMLERGLNGSSMEPDVGVLTPANRNQESQQPGVAVAPNGATTFVWLGDDGAGSQRAQARRRGANGSLGPILDLGAAAVDATTGVQGRVGVDSTGNATFVWLRPATAGDDTIVMTRTLRADGNLTAAQNLSPSDEAASEADVAVSANGDAVFAWTRDSDAGTGELRVRTRRRSAAGAFSAIQTVSEPGVVSASPDVAVDADGDATYIWRRFGETSATLQTRRRTAAGSLSAVQSLSGRDAPDADVAVDPDDDAGFTWIDGLGRVQTRARTFAGNFSSPQTIGTNGGFGVQVGMSAAGNSVYSWLETSGSDLIAKVRRRTNGTFGSTQSLSGSGATAERLQQAVAANGDSVFVWERNGAVQGRRSGAAGGLGPVLSVSE